MNFKSRKGLTLIEILLVLVLIGFVFSIIGGRVFNSFGRGQKDAAKLLIAKLQQDLDRYRFDCNRYPGTEQGLAALVSAPSGGTTCANYDPAGYLKKIPKDPWQHDFVYSCDDGINYEIKSLGADGAEGGEDANADISSKDI
jgi:general secretion pathway protein G